MQSRDIQSPHSEILTACGLPPELPGGGSLPVFTPVDGSLIANLAEHGPSDASAKIASAARAFRSWRLVPAPRRGELVRRLGDELRREKETLGRLVTLECGKILPEGLGEVQEMIDICDFAVGLSRQLYGLTIASERPGHAMRESWHPLGPCGGITAFHGPVAPGRRNAACGGGEVGDAEGSGGQWVGLIQDVPTGQGLFDRMIEEAQEARERLDGAMSAARA